MGVTHKQSLLEHSKMQSISLVLALATTCLAANLPLDLPQGPQSTSGSPGTPLDMLLQHQHITRSPAMVTPRVESVPSTRLSKPIPRPTSSGVFVTVQELNMVADSEFSAPKYISCFQKK